MVGCEFAYRLKLSKRGGECRGIAGRRRRSTVDSFNERQQFLDGLNYVAGCDVVAKLRNLKVYRVTSNRGRGHDSAATYVRKVRPQRSEKRVLKRRTAGLRAVVNRAKKEALECGAGHRIEQGRFVLIGTEAV